MPGAVSHAAGSSSRDLTPASRSVARCVLTSEASERKGRDMRCWMLPSEWSSSHRYAPHHACTPFNLRRWLVCLLDVTASQIKTHFVLSVRSKSSFHSRYLSIVVPHRGINCRSFPLTSYLSGVWIVSCVALLVCVSLSLACLGRTHSDSFSSYKN